MFVLTFYNQYRLEKNQDVKNVSTEHNYIMQQLENNNVNKKYNWWQSVSLLAGITFLCVTFQDF